MEYAHRAAVLSNECEWPVIVMDNASLHKLVAIQSTPQIGTNAIPLDFT
jgi:hypothetical protein